MMTVRGRRAVASLRNSKGQSLVELLLFFPTLLMLTYSTVRVNMAIQAAIVNQKYARAQTLYLAANSSRYPSLNRRAPAGNLFGEAGMDVMYLGVSDNAPPSAEGSPTGARYVPQATTITITRKGKPIGNDEPKTEDHNERGRIRIRNNTALCTQYNPKDPTETSSATAMVKAMTSSSFQYCRSPL